MLGVALVWGQALRVKGGAHTGSRADASANDGSGAGVGARFGVRAVVGVAASAAAVAGSTPETDIGARDGCSSGRHSLHHISSLFSCLTSPSRILESLISISITVLPLHRLHECNPATRAADARKAWFAFAADVTGDQ